MPIPSKHRRIAESFGTDAERYDRTRPRYPLAMVERIVAASPGPDLLDVGIGTGIAARRFREAGCRVLGVDPDPRMAEVARRHGFEVEVSRFEEWEPGGRTFDTVVAGQAWHWVDPVAGAARAAEVLRPGGRLALFWNAFQPSPEVAAAFSAVYRRVAPSLPFDPWAAPDPRITDPRITDPRITEPQANDPRTTESRITDPYAGAAEKTAAGLRVLGEPEVWRFPWKHHYSRDAWLDQVPTAGGHHLLPPAELAALLAGLGAAVDAMGGRFTMTYTTVVVTAAVR